MLSLSRNASRQGLRPLTRSLAEVVNHNRRGDSDSSSTAGPSSSKAQKQMSEPSITEKVPVREDHGLYAFFRRKPGAELVGEARYEVVETPEGGQLVTGVFTYYAFVKAYN